MVQTSLVPTVIALSQFFASNFPNIYWYPYWYLGNPYRFLIGPIVPLLLMSIKALKLPLYESYLFLIGLSIFIGALGIYFLLKDWGVGKRQAVLSAILYLIIPVGFYLLNYQNGLNHIAFGVIPFTFLLYRRFLALHPKGAASIASNLSTLLISLLIAFALLINVSILLTLIIGFTVLFIASDIKGNFEDKIIKTILIFILAIFLSSIWYTPKFWWVLLSNPSVGGVPLFNLITLLFKLLLNLVPVILAILIVKWRKFRPASQGEPKGYLIFAVLFFSSFLFLTIIRFFSDPDFVADWVGFGLELQFGLAILLGIIIVKLWQRSMGKKVLVCGVFIMIIWLDGHIVNNSTIQQFNNEYQARVLRIIKQYVGEGERVFLSGSSVFWIDSKMNVMQVRGGVDQVAIHPFWSHGAFQIREGARSDLAGYWLIALGASYVLVHEKNSAEPFGDFKHPEKFKSLKLVREEQGDLLYKVERGSIARVASRKILSVPRPRNGADGKSLSQYTSLLKESLDFSFKKPNEISFKESFGRDEVVSLAVSYDSGWRLVKGKGSISPDSLGNMIIIPEKEGEQEFILMFKEGNLSSWLPVLLSVILIVFISNYNLLFPNLKKRFPSLSLGFGEDDY